METARKAGVTVKRVTVQGTTLDDVFLHYTAASSATKWGAWRAAGHSSPVQMRDFSG